MASSIRRLCSGSSIARRISRRAGVRETKPRPGQHGGGAPSLVGSFHQRKEMIQMRIWTVAASAALISTAVLASSAGAQQEIAICVSANSSPSQRSVAPPCTPPPLFCPVPLPYTESPTGVTASAATLNGRVFSWSGDARWHFEWGTSPFLHASRTPDADVPIGDQHVSALVSAFAPGTKYYVRLVVIGCGITQYGEDVVLNTPAATGATGANAVTATDL